MSTTLNMGWDQQKQVRIAMFAADLKLNSKQIAEINRTVFNIKEGKSSNETSFQSRLRRNIKLFQTCSKPRKQGLDKFPSKVVK